MPSSRDEQIAWVKAVQAHLGVSLTELARRARIAPSTIQRPINDPQWDGMLSGRTLAAIGDAAGLKPLEFPARMRGMAEAEAEPYVHEARPDAADNVERAVRELCRGRNGRDPWVMRSYALEMAGILPGDVMILDMNLAPQPRDVVCAQIYDWSGMKAETIFRLYQPPFLLTHSMRAGPDKPITVDNQSVVIKGVVGAVLRARN